MNTVMTVAEPLPPMVSVIIANHNGGAFIEDALASAARQTVRHIEIIVVDDVSTDDSTARVEAFAARDPRVSLIRMTQRTGPGAARNQALRVARGTWIAVLDSDDLMHPRRLAELVEAGMSDGVELVADNQLVFDHARVVPARPLLDRNALPIDGMIDIADYVVSNRFFSRAMPLGYLKPLFLRSFLERTGCRYDPTLLIAEDYDLVLRLLLSGARFRVLPQMTYFYRRHSQSISHRLSEATLLPMLAADTALRTAASSFPALTGSVAEALDVRRETIVRALGFEALVAAIKARDWGDALRIGCRRPSVASLLRVPVADRLRRLLRRRPSRVGGASSGPRVSLVSRQRIVGPTNGSSAYLLALCESLKQAGYEIDLVSPSPAMFGRWPALRLDPVMDVFASIRIRDSIRIGRVIVARDPRIALRAAGEVAHRLLARLHVRVDAFSRKAPHAIAVPWTDADRIFVVDAIRRSSAILTD
ncbi:MAG: glycosyltransferase family 2 protein, partial [Janthinobacterium lividum]